MKKNNEFEKPLSAILGDNKEFILFKGNLDVIVKGIESNSKKVKDGFLFAALKGFTVDGAKFINDSVNSGAKVILCRREDLEFFDFSVNITILLHDNPRRFFTFLVSEFYKEQPEVNVAVTGTNGKTSVVFFCMQFAEYLGCNSSSVGTLGITDREGTHSDNTTLTTANPVDLYSNLSNLYRKKVTHNFIEVSSHGLEQYRADKVNFQVAAFTSFSKDHLDYHKTMENYLNAKLRLFSEVMPKNSFTVINSDMSCSKEVIELCKRYNHRVVTYGYLSNDIKITEISKVSADKLFSDSDDIISQYVKISYKSKEYEFRVNLAEECQVYNIVCSLGIMISLGFDIEKILLYAEKITSPPGRMELAAQEKIPAFIFVDFAHTEDALEQAIKSLLAYKKNKLWLVFGCGGERYKAKRYAMGKIANNLADEVIITNDNPRNEDPEEIAEQIKSACPRAKIILDRKEAIKFAISCLKDGDILLVAGKGHEKYQITGDKVFYFNDAETIKEIISTL